MMARNTWPGPWLSDSPEIHAARVRVGVRRAVALEVVEDDQPVRPDRHLVRQLAEDVVGVDAALLGLRGRLAGEVVLEPGHDRPGRGLPGLDRVLAGDHRIGVGAPEAGAVHRLGGLAR